MAQIKEIFEDVKSYLALLRLFRLERLSKEFAPIHSEKEIQDRFTLSRSGWPTKITPTATRVIKHKVSVEPRITSKQLQASLILANGKVHDGIHGRKMPLFSKKNTAAHWQVAKAHIHKPKNGIINAAFQQKTLIVSVKHKNHKDSGSGRVSWMEIWILSPNSSMRILLLCSKTITLSHRKSF